MTTLVICGAVGFTVGMIVIWAVGAILRAGFRLTSRER